MTPAGHAAEDAVVLTAKQERTLDAHTRAVSAKYAKAAAAMIAGGASGRRPVGSGRRLAGHRSARCTASERQGSRVRLDRRQRDRDVSRAGPHTRDRLGSGHRHPDAGQRRHRLQYLLQRAGASHRRPDVHGRWEQGPAAQRHRPDPPLRSGDKLLDARPEHGSRPLVSDRNALEQRRDADHLWTREYARGSDAGRQLCVRSAPRR